jgi:hypothetical protein
MYTIYYERGKQYWRCGTAPPLQSNMDKIRAFAFIIYLGIAKELDEIGRVLLSDQR